MLATSKTLSLIEQKKLQWAREREEMVGLYGLWGRPRNKNENQIEFYNKSNLLPPIEGKSEFEEQNKAEESETSGYLSDSPKHLNEKDQSKEHQYIEVSDKKSNCGANQEEQCWNVVNNTEQESFWAEKKMFKNYKNENWAQHNSESFNRQRLHQSNRNFWHGTPDSLSSDDGTRLRWGDRGVGIGHLWEPVIHQPDSRLPLVTDSFRPTPKWVEKGLKNADGNKAEILIIQHPDDDPEPPPKNFLLGQNAPISLEVIEERERKRKKALEHQNAIKKQLEEREMKRKQEKENRIREERLEEERIKKEQEIERLRYEEEQRKMKQKEEIEKKKEEVMREAIQVAEKRAKEEKRLQKKHLLTEANQKNHERAVEKAGEQPDKNNNDPKQNMKALKYKKLEERKGDGENKYKKEQSEKTMKDSSSQFEEITLAQNFQLLNVNGLPVDGGLALMLDSPPKDNSFLLPHEGVQLALLMSPRNATSTNGIMTNSPLISSFVNTGERILTPSKYRISERLRIQPTNKSTQTNLKYCSSWNKDDGTGVRGKKQFRRNGSNSGSSAGSQKYNNERHHKHVRCFHSSKYHPKPISSKLNLDNRPKWGINRPSVQYKKQSEKDPYYQRKLKEKLKKAEIISIKNVENFENVKEKEMDSIVRLLDCQSDEEEKPFPPKDEIILRNGYRMNSNLSSPVFMPIGSEIPEWKKSKQLNLDSERSRSNDSEQLEVNEDTYEDEEDTAVPGSVGFLTQAQLEAIKQIASLREGLKKLQQDYSNSRSITPFSQESIEK